MKKENPSIIRSKNAMAEALILLLDHESFDQVSVVDICKKAGYTRQTFYVHFDTKDDVIRYYMDTLFFQQFNQTKQRANLSLEQIIKEIAIFWDGHSHYVKAMVRNRLTPIMVDCFVSYLQEFFAFYHLKIKTSDSLKSYVIKYLAGGEVEILIKWVLSQKEISAEEISHLISKMIEAVISKN